MAWRWTQENTAKYIDLLKSGNYKTLIEALAALAKNCGVSKLDMGSSRRAVQQATGRDPRDILLYNEPEEVNQHSLSALVGEATDITAAKRKALIRKIVATARKAGSVDIEELSNKFGVLPKEIRTLVQEAIESGHTIDLCGSNVEDAGLQPRVQPRRIKLASVVGRLRFAAISDVHAGSRFHCGDECRDFLHRAKDEWGAQFTLICGDILDGVRVYRGHEFELLHHGLDSQCEIALQALPEFEDHTYYFIDGNHDSSFWKFSGQLTGRALADIAQSRHGRSDLIYCGPDIARLEFTVDGAENPLKIEILHPDKAGARSPIYHLLNYIESMQSGTKPHLLFTGHEHTHVWIRRRNVHALKVPCFQAQTPYMARKHLEPEMGGLLVEVGLTPNGSLRETMFKQISYYGNEDG